MIRFIFATIAYDPDSDLIPLAVKRLCNALFDRTGSQWLIVEIFGEKGRQRRSDDYAAGQHWSATLTEIERVKRIHQAGIKASRKEKN